MSTPIIKLNATVKLPLLGLGTWLSEPGKVCSAVYEAIKIGIRHIDCAAIYGNEVECGEAIKRCIDEKIVTRDELFITSKLWNTFHQKNEVLRGIKKTLNDLQLEYLNLYLIHWPVSQTVTATFPPNKDQFLDVPIQETWTEMENLVKNNLTKTIGISNFSIKRIEEILKFCKIKPVINQVECHPYLNQNKLKEYCASKGIYITAYSPLGAPGRPSCFKKTEEPILLEDPIVNEIAKEKNVSASQVLIRWHIQHNVVVIPKSVTPSRIKSNYEALNFILSEEDMKKLDSLDRNYRYVDGSLFFPEGTSGPIKSYEDLWN